MADARLITVKPWERSLIPEIEKAIRAAQLGLNPQSDGELVRLPMPALTQERRQELVKVVKKMAEEGKVALRGARRDANEMLKEALKDSAITEDDERKGLKSVQETTDKAVDEGRRDHRQEGKRDPRGLTMALQFREAHATADKKQLNGEWFVLENAGATSVSTAGLQVISGRKGKRGSVLGVIDPGFMLQPGEKILVVSGIPGKKSHGDPPDARRDAHLPPVPEGAALAGRRNHHQVGDEPARGRTLRLRSQRPVGRGQAGRAQDRITEDALPKYQLDIPHTLAADEAKKRIDEATGKLSSDYGASCTWKSDNELAVSRKGLDARVTLEPSRVRIDLNLGFLMTPFADMIKTGITKKLSAILRPPPRPPARVAARAARVRRRVFRRPPGRMRRPAPPAPAAADRARRARPPPSPAIRRRDPKAASRC